MIHPKMKYVYVGIDSHKDTHCAVMLDCFYEKVGEITFSNAPSEFEGFLKEVQKLRLKGTKPAFGLEDISAHGRGLTVFLKEKKQVVKHVNAGLVAAERKSRNTLNKTDSEDAECAARVLLNRFDGLPNADPKDKYWVLGNLVTRRKAIVKMNTALKNQLHSLVSSHYPSYRKFFMHIDCASSLAFFEKYPSPSKLNGITVEELTDLLEHSNRKHKLDKARLIIECVEKDGDTTVAFQEARDSTIQSIIRQFRHNREEIESIDAIISDFMGNFEYPLTSMRGIDTITAAGFIAEIGDISRFSSPAKLARYSGIAPITYSSGKSDFQHANQRGNRTLHSLFYLLAVRVTKTAGTNNKVLNSHFYEYFNKKIAEGKTKNQAYLCVQRRLVNIVWKTMTYNQEYPNPALIDLPKPESKPET